MKETSDLDYYLIGKHFRLDNIFFRFYTNHKHETKMMRMIDYDFIAYDLETIQQLNVITFMCLQPEEKAASMRGMYGANQLARSQTSMINSDPCSIIFGRSSPRCSMNKWTCIIKWEKIAPYIKGIGRRFWFLHLLEGMQGKLDLKALQYRRGYTNNYISEEKANNLLIAMYEGIIRETVEQGNDPDACMVFGRSIYCNFARTLYIGYTSGLDRHGKGLYAKNNVREQQGYWTNGKLEPLNSYPVVDFTTTDLDPKKEQALYKKIMRLSKKKETNNFNSEGEQTSSESSSRSSKHFNETKH